MQSSSQRGLPSGDYAGDGESSVPGLSNEPSGEQTTHLQKPKQTPLPKLKMFGVSVTLLTEAMSTSMLLPFVGLFVAHLQGISVEEAGYFSGILIGLFMLGQVASTKLWGYLSDVYGRKPPLVNGLLACAVTMLLFGMSPNIWVCCILRFIHGFFNGNVLIAKIIIADITDSTNATLGFSCIGILFSIGTVLGPAIGGFLYDPFNNPKLQWMHVKEGSYLARNPAFLPSFFIGVYSFFNFMVCLIMLPETNPHPLKSIRDIPVLGWFLNLINPQTAVVLEDVVVEEEPGSPVQDDASHASSTAPTMTYKMAMKDVVLYTIIVVLMCLCVTDMTYGEILPLWMIAPVAAGGLGFFSDDVGMVLLLCSLPTIVSNLMLPKVVRKIGDFSMTWQCAFVLLAVVVVLTPFAALLPSAPAFAYVWLMCSLKNIACAAGFTLEQLLVGNAAPPGTLGAVYGISQSFGAMIRCVVPFIVAPVFAWSISGHHIFPFNHYFVFFLCVLPLLYAILLCRTQPIERTPEELAAWESAANGAAPQVEESTHEVISSLVNSFTFEGDAVVAEMMEAKAQKSVWLNRTAPRGRGKELDAAAKQLEHEDWRVLMADSESENESGLV